MTLGGRIQQIRIDHGLTQEEFARKLDTTRQSVSRWELDQTYPEIAKIVLMSKVFSVSTDSILKDGISTFDAEIENYVCGVYRGNCSELVDTERFALLFYCSSDKSVLGAKLYRGYENKKKLTAMCERDVVRKTTEFAYLVGEEEPSAEVSNSERLSSLLGSAFDPAMKDMMQRRETFLVDHSTAALPTVKEAGIPNCLKLWRMADCYRATHPELYFSLCTDKTEYVFSVSDKNANVYCGASCNKVFDLGLFGGGQFFRIRNYGDNSEKWCGFGCDFQYEMGDTRVPTEHCELGKCVVTDRGYMWCVKRYSDDEIVLQGCGDDEYVFRRADKRTERFLST